MRCGSAAWSITRSHEKKRIVVFGAVVNSKKTALFLASGLTVAPLLWIRIYRTVIVLLQIVCIWRLPPAVLCCHSDCQSGSDWRAGVVASRLMLDGLAECRPSSFPASLSDDDFPAVHDVQAFPESFGWRGVCANLHSKAVEDVVAFIVVSCDVADTCVWNI